MRRCCICGEDFEGEPCSPYPLVSENDTESVCCTDCYNKLVNRAKKFLELGEKRTPKIDDMVIILYSPISTLPLDVLKNDQVLGGEVTDTDKLPEGYFRGAWGNFLLNIKTDNYVVIG